MTIVPFNAARSRLRPARPVLPPPVLSGAVPEASRSNAADDIDDRLRMKQNMAALLVIVAIVVLGTWLIDSLRHYSRLRACIEAGHRNCIPVELKYQPSPYHG
jgi:hypothetical protein